MSHRRRAPKKVTRPKKGFPQAAVIGGVVLLAAIIVLVAKGAKSAGDAPAAAAAPGAARQPVSTAAVKPAAAQATATVSGELPEVQLGRLLAAGKPVLGFYHSTNCTKCKQMMATVAEVYPEFEGTVGLVDIDVYDKANTGLLSVAGIRAIPTQIFYDKSGQQKTVLGVMTAEELREQLRTLAGGQ
jgi:thiol:disulfide interchange protein